VLDVRPTGLSGREIRPQVPFSSSCGAGKVALDAVGGEADAGDAPCTEGK
jgi:hypothetical protein